MSKTSGYGTRVRRVAAGAVVTAAVVSMTASMGACGASGWPASCPANKRFSSLECAQHMATEVCTWSESQHAKNKKILEGPGAEANVDFVATNRCGCSFQWFTECFLATEMDASGYYVVATGAPGCAKSKAFASVHLSIDEGQCGSIGQVMLSHGNVGH